MSTYNFDQIIERKGTGALKTDALKERFGCENLIPLWIADMEFPCGDFILDALHKRVDHSIFGYTGPTPGYIHAIINWQKEEHNWEVKREWLNFIPGIVKGLAFSVMCFTNPGDKVIIQPPVYTPFSDVPRLHNRQVVHNPLIEDNGSYLMDLEGLRKLIDKDCKILILCNPHNPVGITWSKETLQELAEICYENNILVVSDEIHSDMPLWGRKHHPFATVSEHARENSITFMAPSKTFNIAGLVSSYCIVPNEKIRTQLFKWMEASEFQNGTVFAFTATEVAYNQGREWKTQMLQYVQENINFVEEYLKTNIPQLKAFRPQASFLIWLDCRELNLSQEELVSLFINKAKLALNNGEAFGKEGKGFMRLNVGTPRAILEKALNNLKKAVASITQ